MTTSVPVASGVDLKGLDSVLAEFYDPGQKVELVLATSRPVSQSELSTFVSELRDGGINLLSIQEGSTSDYPNAIRLEFRRPSRPFGVAAFPISGLIMGIAVVLAVAIVGWTLGKAVTGIVNNLPLLIIMGAGTIIAVTAIKSKGAAGARSR